jgi:phosphoribosylamine--glycine ligase
MACGGYPGKYAVGHTIEGVGDAEKLPGVTIFHAGTAMGNGKLVTGGGRVFGVTAIGDTLKSAIARAYDAVDRIHWEGAYYRSDIGRKALLGRGRGA